MNKTGKEKEAVLDVFAAMVRPLMRVAFEFGISAGEIAGVVRRVYIQALEARLKEQKRPTTEARLAVMAGLPKSDISALRQAMRGGNRDDTNASANLDQVGRVLTVWHTDSNFSGAYGVPIDLDLRPIPGSPRRTFRELVDLACPEANEEALLDELVVSGSVELIDDATARCLARHYVVNSPDVAAELTRIHRVARFLGAVAVNFAHNLSRADSEPLYFERTVVSDVPLSDAGRDQFLAAAREKGQAFVTELDTFVTRLAVSEQSQSGKKYGVGVYFFEEGSDPIMTERKSEEVAKYNNTGEPTALEEIDVLAGLTRSK